MALHKQMVQAERAFSKAYNTEVDTMTSQSLPLSLERHIVTVGAALKILDIMDAASKKRHGLTGTPLGVWKSETFNFFNSHMRSGVIARGPKTTPYQIQKVSLLLHAIARYLNDGN